jgi:hypothetical protein
VNRERLEHRATISRPVVTREDGKTTVSAPVVESMGVPCWVEGVAPQLRRLLFGRRESARYMLSWMDDLIRNEDLVTLTKPELGTFVVRGIQHDVQGGYWIGTLEEHTP